MMVVGIDPGVSGGLALVMPAIEDAAVSRTWLVRPPLPPCDGSGVIPARVRRA